MPDLIGNNVGQLKRLLATPSLLIVTQHPLDFTALYRTPTTNHQHVQSSHHAVMTESIVFSVRFSGLGEYITDGSQLCKNI